ncbi:MAG: copper homeostasis membrane protein CopD [Croceibacterium sp.]
MIELAIIALRLLQYTGAAILFGSSLFFLYAPAGPTSPALARATRRLLTTGAAILAVAALLAIAFQASLFTGSLAGGFSFEAVGSVISFMDFGKAAVARAVAAGAALLLLVTLPLSRGTLVAAGSLGAIAAASLAWMGHAAASESWVHLVADALHAWAAALWIGALFGFLPLLRSAEGTPDIVQLETALVRFSALGVPLVLVLALSGLVNGWFVTGVEGVARLPFTPYGQLLLLKLAAFAAMLTLAGLNRYYLTPALAKRQLPGTVTSLRRTIVLETVLGLAVLALVAWLGTLEPLP